MFFPVFKLENKAVVCRQLLSGKYTVISGSAVLWLMHVDKHCSKVGLSPTKELNTLNSYTFEECDGSERSLRVIYAFRYFPCGVKEIAPGFLR
jgi:hypothetical protein